MGRPLKNTVTITEKEFEAFRDAAWEIKGFLGCCDSSYRKHGENIVRKFKQVDKRFQKQKKLNEKSR